MALRADEVRLEISWVGGVKGYRLGLLRDLCHLGLGQREQVESARVRSFATLEAAHGFASRMEDRELLARIKLVRRYSAVELLQRLQRLEAAAERQEQRPRGKPAGICLATVHKAKGLEWDTVVLADDFPSPEDLSRASGAGAGGGDGSPGSEAMHQEVNALYVAVTRAARALQPPPPLLAFYAREAEAVALVEPGTAVAGPCPFCATAVVVEEPRSRRELREEEPFLVPVGSVSARRLCSDCARHGAGSSGSNQ
mmetsp:Transcript_74506/g.164736  ORF Transcript_74506/g.164736 Transcript_74506/m.164736 type:complete len:255 (-) Transcript_74506:86-850(-)